MKIILPILVVMTFSSSVFADTDFLKIERNFTPNWERVSKLFDKQYQSLNNVYLELCIGMDHKTSCDQVVTAVETTISAAGHGVKPQYIEEKISKLNSLSKLATKELTDA